MTKDDKTWLDICYVCFALIMGYVGLQAMETLGIQSGWADRYDEWYELASNVIAIGFGISSSLWLRSSPERREYHLASVGEVKKVTWPSIPDTKRMTIVVVIVVAIFSVILGVFDLGWSEVLQLILP